MNENVRLLEDLREALMEYWKELICNEECEKCSFCLTMGHIMQMVDKALKEAYNEE